uniref:CBS domain-containing protein n=1 Tax=Aegilops tauschii subsp. strangulata TaxID=200361 RepID=A0A453RVZ4_AEGTS
FISSSRPSHRFLRTLGLPSPHQFPAASEPDASAVPGREKRGLAPWPPGCCSSPSIARPSLAGGGLVCLQCHGCLPVHPSCGPQPHPSARSRSPPLEASCRTAPPWLWEGGGVYTVGDFMTKREQLHVVKPSTSVDEALERLVEHRITGFPVTDDHWNLVGVVSDYDLLALDSISGNGQTEADIFPEVDSTWKTFHHIQKLLSKTNGKVVSDVMTSAPLVVRETTNLEDAARLLLVSKYRRLPVVDSSGKLVGIITRGNVVRAALEFKKNVEGSL